MLTLLVSTDLLREVQAKVPSDILSGCLNPLSVQELEAGDIMGLMLQEGSVSHRRGLVTISSNHSKL